MPVLVLSIRQEWGQQRKLWAGLMLPLVLVMMGNDAYIRMGTDDEYKEFREWNAVRGKFNNFPIEAIQRGNQTLLEENNWTSLHYSMLQGWLIFDRDVHNEETVGKIIEHEISFFDMLEAKWDVAMGKYQKFDWTRYQHMARVIVVLMLMLMLTKPPQINTMMVLYVLYVIGVALALSLIHI